MTQSAQALTIVQPHDEHALLSTVDLKQRRHAIQDVMAAVMQEGTHYGVIPGTGNKLALLKPGAEVLCSTFRLAPRYVITRTDLGNGHREYDVRTTLMHVATEQIWGEGVGSCSTMEKKYRYRQGQENPDIADVFNTVLKMAKKRSLVDAILTATAASDMFSPPDDDMDDEPRDAGSRQQQSAVRLVSDKQIGFLMSTAKQFGITEQQLLSYLAQAHNIQSRKDIPAEKFDGILSWVKAQQHTPQGK